MYFLQHYHKIKRYLKTCNYISYISTIFIICIFILSIYMFITKLPIYSCYQEAYLLGHDLDIIVLTEKGCGTIIKDEFIPLEDL